jgi:hypothetical protein
MFHTSALGRRLRERRHMHQFETALRTASPAMRQELLAAAARQSLTR